MNRVIKPWTLPMASAVAWTISLAVFAARGANATPELVVIGHLGVILMSLTAFTTARRKS